MFGAERMADLMTQGGRGLRSAPRSTSIHIGDNSGVAVPQFLGRDLWIEHRLRADSERFSELSNPGQAKHTVRITFECRKVAVQERDRQAMGLDAKTETFENLLRSQLGAGPSVAFLVRRMEDDDPG